MGVASHLLLWSSPLPTRQRAVTWQRQCGEGCSGAEMQFWCTTLRCDLEHEFAAPRFTEILAWPRWTTGQSCNSASLSLPLPVQKVS